MAHRGRFDGRKWATSFIPWMPGSTTASTSSEAGSTRSCDVQLDKDGDGSVEPLVAMLDRLWAGQVSRHCGGSRSRDQTLDEARTAVHLAATLVQLLSAGALTRRNGL